MRVACTTRLLTACAVLWAAACRPSSPGSAPPRADGAVAGDTSESPAPQTAVVSDVFHQAPSPLVGAWELITPGRLAGIRLTVGVDSVTGSRVHGQLVHYMAGDVGVDASRFAPFLGETGGDSVRMPIRARDGSTGLLFEGSLRGDTIHLHTFAIGPDTLRGEAVREVLVRRRD